MGRLPRNIFILQHVTVLKWRSAEHLAFHYMQNLLYILHSGFVFLEICEEKCWTINQRARQRRGVLCTSNIMRLFTANSLTSTILKSRSSGLWHREEMWWIPAFRRAVLPVSSGMVSYYITTQRHKPEDRDLYLHHHENIKSSVNFIIWTYGVWY